MSRRVGTFLALCGICDNVFLVVPGARHCENCLSGDIAQSIDALSDATVARLVEELKLELSDLDDRGIA